MKQAQNTAKLWIQAAIYSALMLGIWVFFIPAALCGFSAPLDGWWQLGWLAVIAGLALHVRCLRNFVTAGGTPTLFWSFSSDSLFGSEPTRVMSGDVYRFSRNPMYLAALAMVFGQAIGFAAPWIAAYGVLLLAGLHVLVVFAEERHLQKRYGMVYARYVARTPRWLGAASGVSKQPASQLKQSLVSTRDSRTLQKPGGKGRK